MIEHHYGVLLVLGVSAFVGLFGARFFQKIKVPKSWDILRLDCCWGKAASGWWTSNISKPWNRSHSLPWG